LRLLKSLYFQVLIGIALGILVGALVPKLGVALEPVGTGFVKLIKLVIAPLVFCTVAGGIAHIGDMRKFGRVGFRALIYFEVVSTFALALGLVVGLVAAPGRGFDIGRAPLDSATVAGFVQKSHAQTVSGYFLGLIPDSYFSPFASGDLLQVIVIALLTGLALTQIADLGLSAVRVLDRAGQVCFAIIRLIVRLAPVGAFGAMAFLVGKFGLASLIHLGALVATFYLTSILFVVVVLGAVARLAGFSIFKFVRYIGEELLVVLGTSSSESVLPQLMAKLEALGVKKAVVGVVVPAGYSFNLDGTNIYMTLATLFLAQATRTSLSPTELAAILLVSMVTSKGASGVTGAGFITLAATLSSVGKIPVESLALLVGVDRFMSECRALTNTVGNGVASIVVARWNGDLDLDLLHARLGRPLSERSALTQAEATESPQ
jgi:aerobic C4-dicarboxylate transport protein